jgi:hypothetical protein
MAKKEWSPRDRSSWKAAPSLRRQHLCSLQGPWDWSDSRVLRIPYAGPRRGKAEKPTKAYYQVTVPTPTIASRPFYFALMKSHYILRLQNTMDSHVLLLLKPGDLRKGRQRLEGLVPEAQRCPRAVEIVGALRAVYEGGNEDWSPTSLERWKSVRHLRLEGNVL